MRFYLDTAYSAQAGRTIHVPAQGDFRAALNAARPGDVITLQAGATSRGPFTLPNKKGTGWITIRTSAPDGSLAPPATRVTPADARNMPKLVIGAGLGAIIRAAPGAHHYRFIGIEISPAPGSFVFSLVELGWNEIAEADLPHDIIFDRCYIHGDPAKGARKGLAFNGKAMAVKRLSWRIGDPSYAGTTSSTALPPSASTSTVISS